VTQNRRVSTAAVFAGRAHGATSGGLSSLYTWQGGPEWIYFGKDATTSIWPSGYVGEELDIVGTGNDPTTGGAGPSNTNYAVLDGSVKINGSGGGKTFKGDTGSAGAPVGNVPFIWEMVFKCTDKSSSGYGALFTHISDGSGPGWTGIYVSYNAGGALRMIVDSSYELNGTLGISAGTWYHAVFVKNGANGYHYINGVARGTTTGWPVNVGDPGTSPLTIAHAPEQSSTVHATTDICFACMTFATLSDPDTDIAARFNDLFSGAP